MGSVAVASRPATRRIATVSTDAWSQALSTRWLGRHVIHDDVVDSTSARAAAALAKAPLPTGTVFVANRQTRGRGTSGRSWLSDDDGGLWMSLVLQEPLRKMPLSFLPGIAVVDVARALGADVHLKWPNDVLIEGRKLAGALVESQRQPDGRTAWIVGLGVNVAQERFPHPIADVAASLRLATGQHLRPREVFARLLARMEELYDGRTDLVAAWRERSRMLGRRLRCRRGDRGFEITTIDLTDEGHLIVVHDDGKREEWVATTDLSIDPRY